MVQATDKTITELVDAIVQEIQPEEIIMFGSRGRGDSRPDSDVDLLIVESEPFGPGRSRWTEMSKLWMLVARCRMPVDVLLYSRDEVERWRHSRNHVIGRATREGKPCMSDIENARALLAAA